VLNNTPRRHPRWVQQVDASACRVKQWCGHWAVGVGGNHRAVTGGVHDHPFTTPMLASRLCYWKMPTMTQKQFDTALQELMNKRLIYEVEGYVYWVPKMIPIFFGTTPSAVGALFEDIVRSVWRTRPEATIEWIDAHLDAMHDAGILTDGGDVGDCINALPEWPTVQ
jgi:hypothetical protein